MNRNSNRENSDIKSLVEGLVSEHETRDPYTLCKELGVYVLHQPLVDIRGFFQFEDGVSIIHIREGLSEHADRFVCAHELGHCFLHTGLNRIFMDNRTFMETSRFENRADEFACLLLYGPNPLLREPELYDWQLADCLNVPAGRVRERLAELGVDPEIRNHSFLKP